MAYSDLDDVDYLVEDNVMDEFAHHRKWKRPMVEWHIGGASWEQNANAGNDSGNQLVPMITPSACACSQELEHFHIHQGFTNIRVKDPGNTTYHHDEQ